MVACSLPGEDMGYLDKHKPMAQHLIFGTKVLGGISNFFVMRWQSARFLSGGRFLANMEIVRG